MDVGSTAMLNVTDAVRSPLVAAMVTGVDGDATAVTPAANSNPTNRWLLTLLPPGNSWKEPMTPGGRPEKLRSTGPLNPPE
jgi:hypothetical protein